MVGTMFGTVLFIKCTKSRHEKKHCDIISPDQLWMATLSVWTSCCKQTGKGERWSELLTLRCEQKPPRLLCQTKSEMSPERIYLNANVCAGSCVVFELDCTEQCVAMLHLC